MLPLPRAAIFGASAATRKYAARTLAAKSRSKVRGRPEPGEPGVVDQHVDRARLLGEVVHLGRAGEVGRHEAGLTAHRGDRAGHREAAIGVPPVHDDLGALPAELFGRCPADARGGPGYQGADALEVSLVVHLSSFRSTDFVMPRVSRSSPQTARLRPPSR